jgi:hypothetical protein
LSPWVPSLAAPNCKTLANDLVSLLPDRKNRQPAGGQPRAMDALPSGLVRALGQFYAQLCNLGMGRQEAQRLASGRFAMIDDGFGFQLALWLDSGVARCQTSFAISVRGQQFQRSALFGISRNGRRLSRSEMFRCTPSEASRVIRAAALAYTKPWAVTVWLRGC